MIPKCQPHKRIKEPRARPMNADEKRHVERIAQMPCLVCGAWPVEVNHVKDGPGGKRDHRFVSPLCPRHHRITVDSKVSYESMSREAFNEMIGFDLLAWAKEQWKISQNGR